MFISKVVISHFNMIIPFMVNQQGSVNTGHFMKVINVSSICIYRVGIFPEQQNGPNYSSNQNIDAKSKISMNNDKNEISVDECYIILSLFASPNIPISKAVINVFYL